MIVLKKRILSALIMFLYTSGIYCEKRICKSEVCLDTAYSFAKSLKLEVEPCDNFYQFVCGNWASGHIIPEGVKRYGYPSIIAEKTFDRLRQLLEEPKNPNQTELETKAKELYRSCMDHEAIVKVGIEPLLKTVNDLGGWPIIMNDTMYAQSAVDWDVVHAKYARMTGEGALFNVNVEKDPFDERYHRITLDQPRHMFEPFEIMENYAAVQEYKAFLEGLVSAMAQNHEIPKESIKKDVHDVFRFRQRLHSIMTYGSAVRDVRRTYNLRTIRELQEWNNNIARIEGAVMVNWLRFFQNTFKFVNNIEIIENATVVVKELPYMRLLVNLISTTLPRVVVNHIHLYFVEKHARYISPTMRNILSDFLQKVTGRKLREKDWRSCVLDNPMKHVLSKMYVQKYFPNSTKEKVERIMNDMKVSFIRQITLSPWLEDEKKQNAYLRVMQANVQIGYNDWILNDSQLAAYYNALEIESNYFQNVLNSEKFEYTKHLELIWKPSKIQPAYAFDVNSFYDEADNTIEYQAALFQWPFYNPELPEVVTYATAGTIIAHELSKIFSVRGNFLENAPNLMIEYKRRVQCIQQEYKNYTATELPQISYDTNNSAEEDFDDVLALNIAQEYFKKSVNKKTAISLPSFDGVLYTRSFFLAYAYQHCEYVNPEYAKELGQNTYSLSQIRVNLPVANIPAFSDLFDCPAGSIMNPLTKCNVWD